MTIFGKIAKLLTTSGYCRHLRYSAADVVAPVGRGSIHAANFVTPFRLWNDVSIFFNSEVISTSGSATMLT